MALVKEYMHGECKIRIYDDYIQTDEKKIEATLAALGRLAAEGLSKKEKKEEATA